MSAPARRAKVERTGADLSVRRQCQLLDVARLGVYRPRPEPSAADLALI
jgi:putative transposase